MRALTFLASLGLMLAAAAAAPDAGAQEAGQTVASAPPGALRLFVAGSMRAPVEAVRAQLAAATGRPVVVESTESRVLQKEIEAGQAFEAALLTDAATTDLAREGKLVAASVTPIAVVRVGAAVRGDAPKLDVSTPQGLKAAILGAHSVRRYYGPAASTPITNNLFAKLDLDAATKDRTVALGQGPVPVPPEAPLGPGQYEIIINLTSAVVPMKGWTYLGLIPDQFQAPVGHSAALSASGDQALGRKAIAVFQSPAFEKALLAVGVSRK